MFAIGQALSVRTPSGPARGTIVETRVDRARIRLADGRAIWITRADVISEPRRGAEKIARTGTPPLEVTARVVEAQGGERPGVEPGSARSRGILFMLFGFSGRIGRSDYWKYTIFNALVCAFYGAFCFGVVMALETGALVAPATISRETVEGALVFGALLPLWCSLAVPIKRLHDRGYSGFLLLVTIVPLFGPFWLFFELGILPGEPRKNRYGEVPR